MILGEFKLAAEQATSLVDTQQSVFLQPTNIVTSVHTTSLQLPYSTGHGAVIIMQQQPSLNLASTTQMMPEQNASLMQQATTKYK